jgi:hypothetical protein
MRGSIAATIILAILNVMDAFFTAGSVNAYGMEVELNPLMKFLIDEYGIWCLYAFKIIFIGFLWLMIAKTPEAKMSRFVPALWALVGAYSVVVLYGALLWSTVKV